MTKSLKLTTAQRELLDDLHRSGKVPCVKNYAPAIKLVALGLAGWGDGNYGSTYLILRDQA